MTKVILLILFGEIWSTSAHILFKKSVNSLAVPNLRSLKSYINFVKEILKIPVIWIGFGLVGVNLIIWLAALAQVDLSIAFPINSMQYIVTLIFARIFLGEKMDRMKLAGTLLVIAGIILVVRS